ncbi:hypothetical protein NVP1161O_094 [Vibrio phage 1.161.O._10N.261.48.C5]|nr:hypothetical protein NVP1161O_094 [Vibrio phage 1.161.O._10N.261.48.C5]
MELTINLKHDVLHYHPVFMEGSLKDTNLFGYQEFSIAEFKTHFEIDFVGEDSTLWSYECKFTDHGSRLVVII